MKKISKIILVLIIILVLMVSLLSIYKFLILKDETFDFKTLDIKTKIVKTTQNDVELYASNIINENITSYNYQLIIEDSGIHGKVFIGEDKKLYIAYDSKTSEFYKISDVEFKTLYKKEIGNEILILYSISLEGDLYRIYLSSLDIKETGIVRIPLSFKVQKFTNLNFKSVGNIALSNIVVLSEDNNIYEATTGIKYNPEIISLLEKYYINKDKTISNKYGFILKDENDKSYKIRYYLSLPKENKVFENASDLIITEDNRIIFIVDGKEMELKIYKKYIKELKYEKGLNQEVKLKIKFDDKSLVTINGYSTEYYGFE